MSIRMDQLRRGQIGRVLKLFTEGSSRRRLLDLGLVPGTPIERMMNSPIGDPVCYRIRGAMIALRGCDAHRIMVTV